MSELCLSSTTKTTKFSSLFLSDLFLFCSFILSHPLYFSYFIFFSPYLLKLLSFLSPLFITTSLLLLALLTLSPTLHHNNSTPQLLQSKVSFLLSTYHAVIDSLSKTEDENEEFHQFEEFEAYRIVFDTSIFDIKEIPFQVSELKSEEDCSQPLKATITEKSTEITVRETTDQTVVEAKSTLEGFLQALDEFESMTDYDAVEEKKKIESQGPKSVKVEGVRQKEESVVRKVSEAMPNQIGELKTDNGGEYPSNVTDVMETSSPTLDSNLGSYGSMRREKEWKRTLACKLFEERHNVEEGGEGMDLLWETYETDSSKVKTKSSIKKKDKKKGEYYEEEEYEEELDGQLCCLQALKFSARKMNMGMGRPNLVKISKAIKGIGWLHRVTSTSHGRKR